MFHRRLQSRLAMLTDFIMGFGTMAGLIFIVGLLPIILRSMGRDTTFSGRTLVWQAILPSIWKSPVLGYGFYAFWQGLHGESANAIIRLHWMFGYAHNGILEIALQLGAVGVALFLLSLAQAARNAWICCVNGRLSEVHWFISLLILSVLYNIDEATVVWPNDLLSMLYIIACCGLAAEVARIPKAQLPEPAFA
jgi:O-antigen ligase